MEIGRINSFKKVFAQLVLLALPTVAFICYLLWRLNNYYSILENDWIKQGAYFASGCFLAMVFYAYRFRFITTAALVLLINYAIYKSAGSVSAGEFDAFYFSVQFLIFSILFSAGWFAGYGLARSPGFTVLWSLLLLVIQIIVVSRTSEIKVNTLINAFVPALAYAFYIIYTAELIRNMNEQETKFRWFVIKRLSGFAIVLLILLLLIFNIFKSDFKAIEKEWGEAKTSQDERKGGQGGESMTQQDKDGGVSNKDQTRLTGSLSKDKQLIFVAKLDNFFGDGRTPNPLYFTYHYYSKFDTLTQTFEKDERMPHNDLFDPDPSQIPLYFAKSDQEMIRASLATKNRKIISAEVYKVNLSPKSFLAPSTAFYCQPISVPKEFKEQFRSAYRAKMWVSDLNSAYFIYNPAGNRTLEYFQERRFEKLREVEEIKGPDKNFMDYYTFMPKDAEYKKIGELAKEVTKNAYAPIDKIIAVRDYFLSKDEFGQPLFAYSDNPGIPGMPSANKLTYFLLENRKGYCAYFAGATLFMLRSLGIPSRIAAGFLTEDRSSKNPGWYWFYQDQAHAWVQVYFQEYGWIDFDTTIPDVNTQQSPQPDGTPPTDLPQTFLVADGEVVNVDTVNRQIKMTVKKLLYHEKDYSTDARPWMLADVSMATVITDTGEIKLSMVKKGMHVTAVSHAEALKDIKAGENDSLEMVLEILPVPVPVDEIKITLKEEEKKQKEKEKDKKEKEVNWLKVAQNILIGISGFALLLFLCPFLIWMIIHLKALNEKGFSAFNRHRAVLYYLNQLGYSPDNRGPEQYALEIDRDFGTRLSAFSRIYQKTKYSTLQLNEQENEFLLSFYPAFIKKVRSTVSFKIRFSRFFNIYNTIRYFSKPKNN